MDAQAMGAQSVLQCVEASGTVEVIQEREFSGDELMKYIPARSKLSGTAEACVEEKEQSYAMSIYDACVEHNCGESHPEGCRAVLHHTENLVVTVVAMSECGID
jgi:hypothetical protein